MVVEPLAAGALNNHCSMRRAYICGYRGCPYTNNMASAAVESVSLSSRRSSCNDACCDNLLLPVGCDRHTCFRGVAFLPYHLTACDRKITARITACRSHANSCSESTNLSCAPGDSRPRREL